jgi:hypothetical protein
LLKDVIVLVVKGSFLNGIAFENFSFSFFYFFGDP